MQEKTLTYYREKIEEVLAYINNHLDEELSATELADRFCISRFHFHRIFKAVLKEPLGGYVKRTRLDTAVKLLHYSEEPVSGIALIIGYNDVSAFSKAFSKQFGISPAEYRNDKNINLRTGYDFTLSESGNLLKNINPKFITLPDKEAASIKVKGEYGGPEVYKAWDQLSDFAFKNKLPGWKPEVFSVYYDDPDQVPPEECTSDVCIVTKKLFMPAGKINKSIIQGGRFAVFRYKGAYEGLWELYSYIYGTWLLTSDIKLRNAPILEKYLTISDKTKPENLVTEIYLPIEESIPVL